MANSITLSLMLGEPYKANLAVFGPLAIPLMIAGAAVSAVGTIAGGTAAASAGNAANAAYQFKAKQEQQAAMESRASAQRAAFEKDRETSMVLSTLQARAAAGGGDATDPTIVKLGGDIAGRGEYQSLIEMYKGENRARGLEDQATGDIMTGQAEQAAGNAKRTASYFSALGTVIGGAGSAYRANSGTAPTRLG